jgi:hypothetical protein
VAERYEGERVSRGRRTGRKVVDLWDRPQRLEYPAGRGESKGSMGTDGDGAVVARFARQVWVEGQLLLVWREDTTGGK